MLTAKTQKKLTHLKQKDEMVTREVWKKMPTKRIQRVSELISVRKVEQEIVDMWVPFVNHVRIKHMQHESFHKDQHDTNLRIINVDFAMNFAAEGQEEIQSALCASIVLFTVAIQLNRDSQLVLLASDCKAKDKNTVFAYLDYVFNNIVDAKNKEIKDVIWSDGPSSEFKNQFMCTALKYFAKKI